MRTNGIQAETSARGFNSLLTRLTVQTGETKRGLEQLGVLLCRSLYGPRLRQETTFRLFRAIGREMRGLSDTQAAELRGLIFGLEQQRVGNALLNDIDLIAQLQVEMQDAAGESQRMATRWKWG